MLPRETIEQQLAHTIESINIDGIGEKYQGKVRDCFTSGSQRVLVTSDRLSAFDVVLTSIPFKGQVLNQVASYWFAETAHIVPNHLVAEPHPNVVITKEVEIMPVEVIVRGYLTGSAWRDYEAGRAVSGITLPQGLRKSQRFDTPLITPSTKAEQGEHDEPISSEEVVSSGLVDSATWEKTCEIALNLFEFGTEKASQQGLILVDTKYEFGLLAKSDGTKEIVLADEVLTPDSSRYWRADSYQERFDAGEDPVMLDKEFVRGWLIERGYMGDGTPPEIPDSFRVDVAERYINLYEIITGREFQPEVGPSSEKIERAIRDALG